jgi:hypothetical protein
MVEDGRLSDVLSRERAFFFFFFFFLDGDEDTTESELETETEWGREGVMLVQKAGVANVAVTTDKIKGTTFQAREIAR